MLRVTEHFSYVGGMFDARVEIGIIAHPQGHQHRDLTDIPQRAVADLLIIADLCVIQGKKLRKPQPDLLCDILTHPDEIVQDRLREGIHIQFRDGGEEAVPAKARQVYDLVTDAGHHMRVALFNLSYSERDVLDREITVCLYRDPTLQMISHISCILSFAISLFR